MQSAVEKTFAGIPQCKDLKSLKADIAILGVPYGTPYGSETEAHCCRAPAVIRHESNRYPGDLVAWDFDLDGTLLGDGDAKVVDCGDVRGHPQDGIYNRKIIRQAVQEILGVGAIPIILGGDDSVPIPVFRAFEGQEPFTILHIDAHIDWRDEVEGVRDGYSSTMRRAAELPHIERIVQVGMRGVGSAREAEYRAALDYGAKIITTRQLIEQGPGCVLESLPAGGRVYISLDFDALDPSAMPAVGAPTPGGLRYVEIIDLIHLVVGTRDVIGVNLVELAPEKDLLNLGAITAMRIAWNVIAALVAKSTKG